MTTKKPAFNFRRLINDFVRSKLNHWLIAISLLVGCCLLLFFYSFKPITVLPSGNDLKFVFFTDTANKGQSQILRHTITDSIIEMEYVLRQGFVDPYVSISISPKTDDALNLLFYNRLIIDIQGFNTQNLGFDVVVPYQSNNAAMKDTVVDFYYNIIDISPQRKQYTIDLNELKVPDYWYVDKNLAPNIKIDPDLKHVLSFNIGTAYATKFNETQKFRLHAVRFERDNGYFVLMLITTEVLFVTLLFIIHSSTTHHQNTSHSLTITYRPIEILLATDKKQKNDFLGFINNNFHDPELSLEKISNHLGVNQRQITTTIHDTFSCNFKSYINQLRIHESKRLLKESHLSMGEIAINVGFNTQSHFNRVFKSVVGISPTEFKDTNYQ